MTTERDIAVLAEAACDRVDACSDIDCDACPITTLAMLATALIAAHQEIEHGFLYGGDTETEPIGLLSLEETR